MKTRIADELRKLRLRCGENLREMASKLEVSSAFLSAVENGKKNMPDGLIMRMKELYTLTNDDVEKLKEASLESQKAISINIEKSDDSQKALAVCFARKFEDIDEETNKRIMELLNRRKQNG